MRDVVILITALVLLGFLSLLSLVLFIVGAVAKRKTLTLTGLAVFVVSTCLFMAAGACTGIRAVGKARAMARSLAVGAKSAVKRTVIEGVSLLWEDDRKYLIGEDSPNAHVLLLKSYVPEDVRAGINPQYYTYFGFRDWWRFPLVYPYGIHAVDVIDDGSLYDERAIEDFTGDIHDEVAVGINGITHIALDQDRLLMRIRPRNGANAGHGEFVIFDFRTGEKQSFGSQEEMFNRARELNFGGKLELMTLREYDALF